MSARGNILARVRRVTGGGDKVAVAARLGHASGTTTLKIYAHHTAPADSQAARVIGEALDRRLSP